MCHTSLAHFLNSFYLTLTCMHICRSRKKNYIFCFNTITVWIFCQKLICCVKAVIFLPSLPLSSLWLPVLVTVKLFIFSFFCPTPLITSYRRDKRWRGSFTQGLLSLCLSQCVQGLVFLWNVCFELVSVWGNCQRSETFLYKIMSAQQKYVMLAEEQIGAVSFL